MSLDETVFGRKCHWTKPVLDENVIGRNRFWMKVSWMRLSSVLDESCFWMRVFLDESFFWMKVFLDESVFWMSFFFAIWMTVYLTVQVFRCSGV